jgi:hypothetical protein
MSNPVPPNPYDQPPVYDDFPAPADNAPALVRLAVIFNYISVGLDAAMSLLALGFGTLFSVAPEIAPKDPGDPPVWVIALLYLGVGSLAAIIAVVKLIATRKLQLARPGAWGWGLAAGIIGCVQLCGLSCICLQTAAGIYTIVILCFENVRRHLASVSAQEPPVGPN